MLRVLNTTEVVRARNFEKHLASAGGLTPLVAARLDNQTLQRILRAQVLVHMAVACFDVALNAWAHNEPTDLGTLLDTTFDSACQF